MDSPTPVASLTIRFGAVGAGVTLTGAGAGTSADEIVMTSGAVGVDDAVSAVTVDEDADAVGGVVTDVVVDEQADRASAAAASIAAVGSLSTR